jgi:DNA-binding beta-propeller fold protein YncE
MVITAWARRTRRLTPAGALAVTLTAGLAAAGASLPANAAAPSGQTSINLGGVGHGVAVDPTTDTAYVTVSPSTGTAYVAVIDLAADAITATIPVPSAPKAIAVDPDTNLVYLLTSDDDSVSVISGATDTVTATIALDTRLNDETAGGIAVDPATGMVYAGVSTSGDDGGVAVINGATNTLTNTITTGTGLPEAVDVDPATDMVYAGYAVPDDVESPDVYVINGATNSVSGTIDTPASLEDLAVDPVSGLLYTANYNQTVTGYNLATDAATGTVNIGGLSVGLAVDPQTATVFAAPEVGVQNVTLISETDNAITGTIPVTIPSRVAVDPDTDTLVVITDADDATVIPVQPPAITSAAQATFTVGRAGSFTIEGSGTPDPTFTKSGSLPAGVTLSTIGTLAGTPASGTAGIYRFTITASNGVAPAATQAFTLTVDQAPAITSVGKAAFRPGVSHSFTVQTTGYPAAKVTEQGKLPPGLRFVANKNGTAVITGKPAAADRGKQYVIRLTANNSVSPAAAQRFTIQVT